MMSNSTAQFTNGGMSTEYRAFCIQRVRDLLDQADARQADLIYRFVRGLICPSH